MSKTNPSIDKPDKNEIHLAPVKPFSEVKGAKIAKSLKGSGRSLQEEYHAPVMPSIDKLMYWRIREGEDSQDRNWRVIETNLKISAFNLCLATMFLIIGAFK